MRNLFNAVKNWDVETWGWGISIILMGSACVIQVALLVSLVFGSSIGSATTQSGPTFPWIAAYLLHMHH
jgi:hypothetical protein